MKRAYINAEESVELHERGKQPEGFKLVPKTLYVKWHDDQSLNHLIFGPQQMRASYSWDSTRHVDLTREYTDQLVEHLF